MFRAAFARPQARWRPPPLSAPSLALFEHRAASAAETWKFYMHQSAPNFATSRGAKLLTEEIEKATNGELKMQLHLSGTLQISPSDITKAVGENIVQLGDDLFNSGNIPLAGIPRLPMLVQSYEDFTKAAAVLQPYIEKAFAAKGSTVLAAYSYPMQVVWGKKKLESLDDIKGLKLRVAAPEQGEFVRRFGGTSITMSAPEVPSALDRGVVDGIFTAGVGAVLWKDLLKYGFLIVVNVNNSYIIANTEAFNKLSPDLQAKLRKVAPISAAGTRTRCGRKRRRRRRRSADAGYVLTQAKTGRNRQGGRDHEALLGRVGEVARARGGRGARQSPRRAGAVAGRGYGTMTDTGQGSADDPPLERGHSEGVVEKTCKLLSALALMVLLVRGRASTSSRAGASTFPIEVSDEVAAYMLVAIAFLSLPVSHINGAFHRVEFVQARLSRRAQADLLVSASSWWRWSSVPSSSGSSSGWCARPGGSATMRRPSWRRRSGYRDRLLVIGMAALCLSLLRSLAADIRRLRSLGSTDRGRNGS